MERSTETGYSGICTVLNMLNQEFHSWLECNDEFAQNLELDGDERGGDGESETSGAEWR